MKKTIQTTELYGSVVKKLTLIMKLSILLLVLSVFSATASLYSQNTTLSLKMKNSRIADVFDQIEKKSDFYFFYNRDHFNDTKRVNINVTDKKVENILDELLVDQNVSYEIIDRNILIRVKKVGNKALLKANQQKKVTGTVVNKAGELLPGVTVLIKGTSKGVSTNADGEFELLGVTSETVLQVSFIGMKTIEVKVGSQQKLKITLEADAIDIGEVIAIGYGTKAKATITGAVEVANSEVISRKINTNAISALASTLPGLTVTRKSGKVGDEGYSFSIRGITSINNRGVQPLVVIDGIPGDFEQLELMNPSDIKNVVLLKDASAAIYGARAANGVVLVTTKEGTGSLQVTYKTDWNMKFVGQYPEKSGIREHAKFGITGFENDGNTNSVFHVFKDILDKPYDNSWVKGPFDTAPFVRWGNTNWVDALFDNASTTSHNISVSGKGKKSMYFFSLGYLNENSMLRYGKNDHDRYNAKLKHSYELNKNLKISSNVVLGWRKLTEPTLMNKALGEATRAWSCAPVFYDTDKFYQFADFTAPAAALALGGEKTNKKLSVNLDLKAIYTFDKALEGLKATLAFGIKDVESVNRSYAKQYYTYNGAGKPWLSPSARDYKGSQSRRELFENTFKNYSLHLNYNRSIGEDHNLSIMAGVSQEENLFEKLGAYRWYMLSDRLHTLNLGDPKEQYNYENANEWALRSFFSRIGYTYKGKYSVEGIFRRDGSSQFVTEKRYKNFYGAFLKYDLGKEYFINNLGVFDNLQVRLSYGESGNQGGIDLYDYVQLIRISSLYPVGADYERASMASLKNMVSLTRTWETISTSNLRIDFGVLNNRLSGSLDLFIRKNKNMLLPVEYPEILGATPPKTNNGSLETKGFELSLSWKDKIGDFSYFVDATLQDDKNKITDLAGKDNNGVGVVRTKKGYAYNSVFVYKSDGIIKTQAELDEYKKLDKVEPNLIVGDIKYRDLDGDKRIYPYANKDTGDKGDLIHLGDLNPRYRFNVRLGASYKNFDFSATLSGVGKRLTELKRQWDMLPGSAFWVSPYKYFVDNTYSADNPNGKFGAAAMAWGSRRFHWNYGQTDLMYQKVWYVKLNDIQLGYTFKSDQVKLLQKLGIKDLRVYANGKDLAEISNMPKGFDPEAGYIVNYHPFLRYVGGGLQITF